MFKMTQIKMILAATILMQIFTTHALAQSSATQNQENNWKKHKVCGKDTKFFQKYCLELIEFSYKSKKPLKHSALVLSGFIQNAKIWDLIPNKDISVAKYLMNRGIKPYVLHVRGIGNSEYIPFTNLDDIAIDDIPMALNFLTKKEKRRLIVIGHSQGAITAAASLSGLIRCGINKNCFNKAVSLKRQLQVKKFVLLAGNSSMTITKRTNFLTPWVKLANRPIIGGALKLIDKFDIETITKYTKRTADIGYWKNLYVLKNVSKESRRALWQKTVDTTTSGIVFQFVDAINEGDITSKGGDSYTKNLNNIRIPVYQQTYEHDQLAEPDLTYNHSFSFIGSRNKNFEIVKGVAHEDFFMEKKLHSILDPVVEFILD